jgi:YD repeat-containing protein
VTTYSYDGLGRLTGKSYSNGDPAVSYTYDAAGRLETAANGTDKLTWSYDLAGQLLSEQSATNASTVSYTQDLAGNRLSLSLEGQLFVSYGYDDASRLTSITRGSSVFGFGYDEVNRRTSMTYPNAITTTYGYDDLNRLTSLSAVHNGTTTITSFGYTYDAAGPADEGHARVHGRLRLRRVRWTPFFGPKRGSA